MVNPYETDALLSQYLLFHYGTDLEQLPWSFGPRESLNYPVRCVSECVDFSKVSADSRALDLGCAVGRSTFELAKHCASVTGIDYSRRFIEAAQRLARGETLAYERIDEGHISTTCIARLPAGVDASHVNFSCGDAHELPTNLGAFHIVLAANLLDRLSNPARLMDQLPRLVLPGGQLILSTPCTWLSEYTSPEHWLGGKIHEGHACKTLEGLKKHLDSSFVLREVKDIPFLIREHARKYQWSVAQASIWRRR